MRRVFITALLLSLSTVLSAQITDTEIDSLQLRGKFLSPKLNSISGSSLIITAKDIQNSPALSVEEVLAHHTGIDIRRRGANGVQTDLSIRGSSFEQVLLLVNGVRMNDSQTGHNTMNLPFSKAAVARIEVIKGPAARRFGQNAYAGVINIITFGAEEKVPNLQLSAGDFNTFSADAALRFNTGRTESLVTAGHSRSDGYRHNTDYRISDIWLQQQYRLNNSRLKFQTGFQEKKMGANGFYATPAATEQYEEVQVALTSLMWEKTGENWDLNSGVFWRRAQDMYLYIRDKPEVYRNMHIGNNLGAEVNLSYNSALGTTGVGMEWIKEFLVSSNLGTRERILTQFFLQHQLNLGGWSFSPGISGSYYSNAGSYFFPGLDVEYTWNKNNRFYGNLSKVHRLPTYTDLYYISRTEQGNPELQPEAALAYEAGYEYRKTQLKWNLSLFGRETENAIDWVKATESEKWNARNIGQVTTQGAEVGMSQQFTGRFQSYSLGYTYLDNSFTQTSTFSKYALDNLRHQLTAEVVGKLAERITAQLSYRFLERVSLPSYHLLDSKITWQVKGGKIYMLANNLTNTSYTETSGVPMPGRWFHAGLEYNIDALKR